MQRVICQGPWVGACWSKPLFHRNSETHSVVAGSGLGIALKFPKVIWPQKGQRVSCCNVL